MGYAWMTQGLQKICDKLLVVLEGGYNLDALAISSEAVVGTLITGPTQTDDINKLLSTLEKKFWIDE